jgi:trimeric autotransporter adhesin
MVGSVQRKVQQPVEDRGRTAIGEKSMRMSYSVVPAVLLGLTLLTCPLGAAATDGPVQQDHGKPGNQSYIKQIGGQAYSEVLQVGSSNRSHVYQEKGASQAKVYQEGQHLEAEIHQKGLGEQANFAKIKQDGQGLCANVLQEGLANKAVISQLGYAFGGLGESDKSRAGINQHGLGNTAQIEQIGWGQVASITQGSELHPAMGNNATIRQLLGSGNLASINQLGEGNLATINQLVRGGEASIDQIGNSNKATLNQSVAGSLASIVQKGEQNTVSLNHNFPLAVTVTQVGFQAAAEITFSKK